MKVIAYCRVSTQKQDLERQMMLTSQFCKEHNYSLVDTIVEKASGTKSEREGLTRLLSLTTADCDMVVVSELSRISREEDIMSVFSRVDSIRKQGINLVFLDDPTLTFTSDKPLTLVQFITLAVKAQGAAEELKKIRDRMKSGRVTKLQRNPYMVTGSQTPFGFEKYANPDYVLGQTPKSLIRINEREKVAVKTCYEMACNGNSCQRIADWLNSTGHQHNNNKGVKNWQATEVLRMLRKRLYIGERTIEGVTHHIEPIVSVELWELANKCISKNRCIITKEEHFNPLKGLLFCGCCGLPMSPRKTIHGKLVYKCLYSTYKLRNLNRELSPCDNNSVGVDTLVNAVWSQTVDRLKNDEYYGQSQMTVNELQSQINEVDEQILAKTAKAEELAGKAGGD